MVECLSSKQKALGLIPSTGKEGREGERDGWREGRLKTIEIGRVESWVKKEGGNKLPRAGRTWGRLGTVACKKSPGWKGSGPSCILQSEFSPFTETR